MRRIVLFVPLIIILLLFVIFFRGLHQDPRLLPSTLIQKSAPAFKLSILEDPTHEVTQEVFLDHLTLLNIWASWCDSCQEEQSFLMTLKDKYPALQVIGMDYKDSSVQAKNWLEKYGNPYAIILEDREGVAAINYGVYGTPESFLINAKGVIIAKHVGVLDQKALQEMMRPQ